MLDLRPKRVNPRVLLRDLRKENPASLPALADRSASVPSDRLTLQRFFLVFGAAAACLTGFGGIVVQAEDSGVMNFIRQNSRAVTRQAPTQYYARQAPAPQYYAPPAFFPRNDARRSPAVAAYAPYVGYGQPTGIQIGEPRRRAAGNKNRAVAARPEALPAPGRISHSIPAGGLSVGRTAYCVRTCDGFFFPLSGSTGAGSEETACRSLCPTAEVKVYVASGSTDIENARSKENGRRYAQMANALLYRKQVDASCTCSANGVGLTNLKDVMKDPSLRRGDVVMTSSGMRVFAGGSSPYRSGNFVGLDAASDLSGRSRELLRKVQNASLPGRSGITEADVRNAERQLRISDAKRKDRRAQPASKETADIARATAIARQLEAATIDGRRYVGPDLPSTLR